MFLRRDKMQMVSAEDALPGRETRPFSVPARHYVLDAPLEGPFPEGLQQAIFGLGCFWGAERKFWETPGVYTTAVGYAGGYTPNPTYEEVCSGRTGHTEAVLVVFDPAQVSYETLLKVFWESHDPTQGMRQGNDVGTQYRSGIYTFDDEQKKAAEASREMFEAPLEGSRLRRHHHGDRSTRRPSTTPRTTTSSTWRRTRWATAASAAPASAAPSASSASSQTTRAGSTDRGRRGRAPGDRRVRRLHAQAVESTARGDAADARRRRPRGVARPQRSRRARGSRRRLPAALAAVEPPVLGDARAERR